MAINEWWSGNDEQRYWLEITDRETLGTNLFAPQADRSGQQTWSYTLVSLVRPGDVVLHYWKQAGQQKAIVGFSQAIGNPEETSISWQPHGTYGRAADSGRQRSRPAWQVPLDKYRDLASPVTLDYLRELEPRLSAVSEELADTIDGPLYLPFAFSDKRPLRTAQAYLAKLPVEIITAIPELQEVLTVPDIVDRADLESRRPRTPRRSRATGYQNDPVLRSAIERHAMSWGLRHLEDQGFLVEDVGATNPFDILAISEDQEMHVEVKGSSGTCTTVELTAGEVREAHASDDYESLLVVVDQIAWSRSSDGSIATQGGRLRIWEAWEPDDDRLVPTSYRYTLPPGGVE